jgi:hypothetical protein
MTCSTNECGTGLGSVILPGDPSNNSVLTATPTFGGIDVSWSLPSDNPYGIAYVMVYRGLTSNFMTALQIAAAGGNTFFDKTPNNTIAEYYYWIKFVSVNGTVGELIGPAHAVARPTIDQVIEQLSERIDSSLLAQSLKTQLDRIELNAQAITTEAQSRVSANNAYSALLTQVQAGLSTLYSTVQTEITTRRDGDSTLASAINTAQSTFGTNLATVQQTLQTNINTVSGKVTDIGALYTVKVDVNGLAGGFGVYNNGATIDAGFNVNNFWVGAPGKVGKYPFIISGNETFINNAVIQNASIDIAKINKATIGTLSALTADMGLITAGQMRFNLPGDPSSTLIIDAASQSLQVWNAGVLRVKLGKLS